MRKWSILTATTAVILLQSCAGNRGRNVSYSNPKPTKVVTCAESWNSLKKGMAFEEVSNLIGNLGLRLCDEADETVFKINNLGGGELEFDRKCQLTRWRSNRCPQS